MRPIVQINGDQEFNEVFFDGARVPQAGIVGTPGQGWEIAMTVVEYERARKHRWYMTARQICVNDIYSFDPDAKVALDDFVDIIGRNFRQPKEGLGFDGSPVAHMWRSMIWPNNFL